MGKVAVVTDSNSGITQAKAKELGVYVLPMPFYINGELFYEDISLSQAEFYEKLAQDFDGRVQVVDNKRISVTLWQSILDAKELAAVGQSASQIKAKLEETALDSSIYITVEDLKYLKKGGRITPAAAALGTVLNLKPVLTIQGAKLDAHTKVRGMKMARKAMVDAVRKDLDTRFAKLYQKGEMRLEIAYSGVDEELARDWQKQLSAAFPGHTFDMAPLSLSISCHIGPGALGVACTRKVGRK